MDVTLFQAQASCATSHMCGGAFDGVSNVSPLTLRRLGRVRKLYQGTLPLPRKLDMTHPLQLHRIVSNDQRDHEAQHGHQNNTAHDYTNCKRQGRARV